jgi:non-ribosomal peptide synthetase component E (peptide arylation enzyme)
VCAVVVRAEGAEPVEFAQMAAFLKAAGLTTHKLPEQLEVVEALPRNPTGKVIKRDLVARFRD